MKISGSTLLATVLLAISVSFSAYAQTTLKIASPQFLPYVYAHESGNIKGVAAEIVAEVFRSMQTEYANRIYPWVRALTLLTKGDVHGLYTITKNKERAAVFYYPDEPILNSKWVFFIRRADTGRLKFDSFDDLRGKKIGLVRDVKYNAALWEFVRSEKNYEIVSLPDLNLKKLVTNRIDYAASEHISGMVLAKELGLENEVVALTANPIETTPLYIVFSPKRVDRQFVDRFSEELKKFKSGDNYIQVLKKYNVSRSALN